MGWAGSSGLGNAAGVELIERELTEAVIGAFYEVYNELRYGLLENLYNEALARELAKRGRRVAREARVPVYYNGEPIGLLRIDMIVDESLVAVAKSTPHLSNCTHPHALRDPRA